MADLSFSQQIWLAIIDKLAFGGALVGVGYLANRYLESHKIRRAFASEVAKQRLDAITDIWKEIGEYEIEAYRATGRGMRIVLEELAKAGAKVPDPLPRDTQQILDAIISVMDRVALPDTAETRVDEWLRDNAIATHQQVDKVMNTIAGKRFVVGDELAGTFERYLSAVHASHRNLRPSPDAKAAYRKSREELRRLRSDLERTSKIVFG